ncbi:MAG: O-methyltransferase [Clostridia bacterium]|nr:O-methyltransferase [Clostridia bacterium]
MAEREEDSSYDYAHRNTDTDVRRSRVSQYNAYKASGPVMTEYIHGIRKACVEREIPVSSEETLNVISNLARIKSAKNILELGTGTGVSGLALLDATDGSRLTTIERREDFLEEAKENFRGAGYEGRVQCIPGDAGEEIQKLREDGRVYDFIFLDCAKVQYVKYLPLLKDMLLPGGVLAADDVLIYGWATGEAEVPQKRHMLAKHIQEYIDAAIADDMFETSILDVGDGLAVSVKIS